MKPWISEKESLKVAFRDTYLAREGAEAGDRWESRVMGRVREIGPLSPLAKFWPAFERTVWRLAPVSGALILALIALFRIMAQDLGYDYLSALAAGPQEQPLTELFELEG